MKTPRQVLLEGAILLERSGFTPHACAVDQDGVVTDPLSAGACHFCISGAARAVGFDGSDGDGSPEELVYIEAMDAVTRCTGTRTVSEWADRPNVSTAHAVALMRLAAESLNDLLCTRLEMLLAGTEVPRTAEGWLRDRRFAAVYGIAFAQGQAPAPVFDREDFSDIDLSGAFLLGARFLRCRLIGANFFRATLHGCMFVDCDAAAATFAEASLCGSLFHCVVLRGARLVGAKRDSCEFSWCEGLNGEANRATLADRLESGAVTVPEEGE